jgi:glutathione S-transferase
MLVSGAGMLLYQAAKGANVRRVVIYMAEKDIDIPRHDVDVAQGEHKSPDFLAMNPTGRVPVLRTDDGRFLFESAAIMEYLEELYPDPPMIGTTAGERAHVRAVERVANDLIVRCNLWFLHSHSRFAGRVAQDLVVAEAARLWAGELLVALDRCASANDFIAGSRPTIADCSLFALFQNCRQLFGISIGDDLDHLNRWYARFGGRPSTAF